MEVILAIGAVQAAFFAVLVLNKPGRSLPDRILAVWLVIMCVHLLINYLEIRGFYSRVPHLVGSTSSLVFLYGPILFIYIAVSIDPASTFKKSYGYHFIPFLLYNAMLVPFYIQSGAEKLAFSEKLWEQDAGPLAALLLVAKAVYGPIYLVLSLRLIRKHRNTINDLFSTHENIDLAWLRYLIWSAAVVWGLFLITAIAKVNVPQLGMADTELFIFAVLSLWILALGYYGIKQSPIFVPETVEGGPKGSKKTLSRKTDNDPEIAEKQMGKLVAILENERPYLQSKLTLNDLAQLANVPAHHLSQLINRHFGKNFFEFINHYRVEEVKRKLADPSYRHLTLLGIGLESGFNSKASFNRIFKNLTGLTPNQYQKKIHEQGPGARLDPFKP